MDSATALALWKKNKPLTLQNTGVSDILRKLPKDLTNSSVNTKELLDVAKKIDTISADKNIKKEKKAAACLVTIKKEIEDSRPDMFVIREDPEKNEVNKIIIRDKLKWIQSCTAAPMLNFPAD